MPSLRPGFSSGRPTSARTRPAGPGASSRLRRRPYRAGRPSGLAISQLTRWHCRAQPDLRALCLHVTGRASPGAEPAPPGRGRCWYWRASSRRPTPEASWNALGLAAAAVYQAGDPDSINELADTLTTLPGSDRRATRAARAWALAVAGQNAEADILLREVGPTPASEFAMRVVGATAWLRDQTADAIRLLEAAVTSPIPRSARSAAARWPRSAGRTSTPDAGTTRCGWPPRSASARRLTSARLRGCCSRRRSRVPPATRPGPRAGPLLAVSRPRTEQADRRACPALPRALRARRRRLPRCVRPPAAAVRQ